MEANSSSDMVPPKSSNVESTSPMEAHCTEKWHEDPEIVQSTKPTNSTGKSSHETYSSMDSPALDSFPGSDFALASLTPSQPTPSGFDVALQSAVYRTDRGHSSDMVPESSNIEPTSLSHGPGPMETHCTEDSCEDPEIVQSHKPTNSKSSHVTYSLMDSPASEVPDSDVALASLTPTAVYRTDHGHSSTMENPDSEKTSESAERLTASRELPKLLNKYELLIAPNEHSIVDDALLKCTPYIVNTKYQVLICTSCQHSVNPDRSMDHIRKYHPHCKVQKNFAMLVCRKFPELVRESIQPLEVPEPVFGLAIPIEPYTVCARCHRGYVNITSWRSHACGNASVNLAGQPEYFFSLVQTFFRGPQICYFPIQHPVPISADKQSNDFDLFKSCFQDLPVSEEIEEPDDYRELNQFLLKEGWINHVKGHSPSALSILTAPPKVDEIFKPIASDVVALMCNVQVAIGTAGYHVRRLLGKRPT